MRRIGVFEAKTHFSALIDAAAGGERIIVTKHGEPIAEIRAARSPDAGALDALLANEIPLGIPIAKAIAQGRR